MSEKTAAFQIKVGGDDDLVRAGDRIEQRWGSLGKTLRDGVGGAVKTVGSEMMNLVKDSVRVATALNTINLGQLAAEARQLDMQFTKFGVGAKRSLESIQSEAEALGDKMLMDPGAVNQQTQAFGKLSYQIGAAGKDLEALNEVATAQNRELGDELPLGLMLRKAIGPAGDMRAELAKLADQAESLGYNGGPQAFEDMLGSMSEALSHVSMETDDARSKLTAFFGALTKNASPDQQKRIGGSIVNKLEGDAEGWSRTVGYDILDPKTGKVKDPGKVMRDYRAKVLREYGTGQAALRVLRRGLGDEAGTALYNLDDVAAGQAENPNAKSAAGSAAAEAQNELLNSKAGQAKAAELKRQNDLRKEVGGPLADAQAWWANAWADHPVAGQVANWVVGGAASGGAGYLGAALKGAGTVAKTGAALAEGAMPVAETAMTLGEAQASLASAEMLGGVKLGAAGAEVGAPAVGASGVIAGIMGGALGGASNALLYAAVRDVNKEDRYSDIRSTAASEIAGRVGRGAKSGEFQDIYSAAPLISRLAQGAGVSKPGDVESTMRQVVQLLSQRNDLPQEFSTTVKDAFKQALRESAVQVTPANPSREKTSERQSSGDSGS